MTSLPHKMYRLRVARGIPTSLVDAGPSREHLTALVAIDWPLNTLASITGITDQGLALVLAPDRQSVRPATARAILSAPYSLAVPPSVTDGQHVPALGAVRRVRALMALGWPLPTLCARLPAGMTFAHLPRQSSLVITAVKWRSMAAVYDALCMTLGPSAITARRAAVKGWAPPLAWDDAAIDDPAALPWQPGGDDTGPDPVVVQRILAGDWRLPANHEERLLVVAAWLERGGSQNELERLTGWSRIYELAREVAA